MTKPTVTVRGITFTTGQDIDRFIEHLQIARKALSKELYNYVMRERVAACEGMTLEQIAGKLGCSLMTVRVYMPEGKTFKQHNEERWDSILPQLKQMRDAGVPRHRIINRLHIGTITYKKLLERLEND